MLKRINKFIAESGLASRRKAEEFINQGRVSVNEKIVNSLSYTINPDKDIVKVDGEIIRPKRNIYILLNKPKRVISSTNDEKNRKTVVDLINTKEKIFPVGRLDYNTTGVLFLTNDGDFSNLLTHPKNKIVRIYQVKLNKGLEEKDRLKLLSGLLIDRKKGKFTNVRFPKKNDRKFVEVECIEGRNHFVKKMFGALKYDIKSLNRHSFAGVVSDIPLGKYRILNENEILEIVRSHSIKNHSRRN